MFGALSRCAASLIQPPPPVISHEEGSRRVGDPTEGGMNSDAATTPQKAEGERGDGTV